MKLKQALDLSEDLKLQRAMKFIRRVNEGIKEAQGIKKAFNMEPKPGQETFTYVNKKSIFNGREIRVNNIVPNAELFSLAQEIVVAADEPFSARMVFDTDTSYHPGSQSVGFDVEVEEGEAILTASGQVATKIPRADFIIGRTLQHVGKIMSSIMVTRDEMQLIELRNDRGIAPFVELMQRKLKLARKHTARLEDQIVWLGGNIQGGGGGEIQGLFDRLSTNSAEFLGKAPSHGKIDDTLVNWISLTSDAIIAQLAKGVEYITRNNFFRPNKLVLPPALMFGGSFSLKRVGDTDSTPLIEWIKRTFKATFDVELDIVAANAMTGGGTVSGTSRPNPQLAFDSWLLLDSNKDYQAIAEVENQILLPSKEDEQATIKQVIQSKTGGLMVKHPSSMYLGTFTS